MCILQPYTTIHNKIHNRQNSHSQNNITKHESKELRSIIVFYIYEIYTMIS